jgi:hypothetical protein
MSEPRWDARRVTGVTELDGPRTLEPIPRSSSSAASGYRITTP